MVDKIVVIDEGAIIYNENVDEITRKLYFETVTSIQANDHVLYSEKCPLGYRIVKPAINTTESGIDLELLFNAIINKTI